MQDYFNDHFFSDAPLVTDADALARARPATAGDVAGARYFCAGNQPATIYSHKRPLDWSGGDTTAPAAST